MRLEVGALRGLVLPEQFRLRLPPDLWRRLPDRQTAARLMANRVLPGVGHKAHPLGGRPAPTPHLPQGWIVVLSSPQLHCNLMTKTDQ